METDNQTSQAGPPSLFLASACEPAEGLCLTERARPCTGQITDSTVVFA
jgi:hypothetical protein